MFGSSWAKLARLGLSVCGGEEGIERARGPGRGKQAPPTPSPATTPKPVAGASWRANTRTRALSPGTGIVAAGADEGRCGEQRGPQAPQLREADKSAGGQQTAIAARVAAGSGQTRAEPGPGSRTRA